MNTYLHTNTIQSQARLRWACRRGMLELDRILISFLDNDYVTLPEAEQKKFVTLLELPDPTLFQALFGEVELDPLLGMGPLSDLVLRLRDHAKYIV